MTNSITKDDFLSSSKLNWDENSFVNLLEDISGKQDGDALDFAGKKTRKTSIEVNASNEQIEPEPMASKIHAPTE
jgi:hypothetical protein